MGRSVIVSCLLATTLLLFAVTGGLAATAPTIESLGQLRDGLSVPTGLDVDGGGNLYVADPRQGAVVKFDRYGLKTASFDAAPVAGGIAVVPDGSRLYVAGGRGVAVLDGTTGNLLGHLGSGADEFVRAYAVDVDAQGFVYVADAGSRHVQVYDPLGSFQYRFGGPGTSAGQFGMISALAVNEQTGEIYVADPLTQGTTVRPKIQVFDRDGQLLRTLSASSDFGPSPLSFFSGMAFDRSGRGYFLDALRNEIRILALPTTYLAAYTAVGYESGQLMGPSAAAFDPLTGRLFVICQGGRIEVFGIDGARNPVKTNAKPGLPVPLSPIGGSESASATPRLTFENATDQDGDALTYEVRVLEGETVVAEYAGLPEGAETSFAQVDVPLREHGSYRWAVQAFDGEDASGWSELQPFYVNAVQEPPSVPVPAAPLAGETVDGGGLLSWQAATDPDPFDTVSYAVEVAPTPSFADILFAESVTGTSVTLAELAGYGALEDGVTYFWRVRAVDNHALSSEASEAGSFRYDTTLLRVTANVPDAKVYLGGNYGYAGRFAGEAPLELRDFPTGAASVVIERTGFEPCVAQIRLADGDNVAVYGELRPAIAPADLKARPLQTGGTDIHLGGDAAPFLVDWDNDGLTDLLVAEASGALTLFRGIAEGGTDYAAGEILVLPPIPGACPTIVDWNNDGRKDLLVGGADGTVTLFLNTGTEDVPTFDGGPYLRQNSGAPITVGAAAAPTVIDIDGDGDKDLVVGSSYGTIVLFRNDGSDAAPQLAAGVTLFSLPSPVAPFFADWDGDGSREMLVAAGEHLYRYLRKADGTFTLAEVLTATADLLGKNGKSGGAFSLGDGLRLFAFDADGGKGKDLIVGNAAGAVRLVSSHGSKPAPAFTGALLDKVAQIEQMAVESAPELAPLVSDLAAAIETGENKEAGRFVKTLRASLDSGTELSRMADELGKLLL